MSGGAWSGRSHEGMDHPAKELQPLFARHFGLADRQSRQVATGRPATSITRGSVGAIMTMGMEVARCAALVA